VEEQLAKAKRSSRKTGKRNKGLMIPGIIIVVAAVIAVIAMNFHFMLTKDGPKVIKKARWGAADTFVDTRDWGPVDWMKHADIMDAMFSDTIDKLQKDIVK
jgi:hypothetical protein